MPVSSLLPVPFRLQKAEGYCLPACVEMVLAFYGVAITQEQLARLLETDPLIGTPFSRISRLETTRLANRELFVEMGKHISWDYLCAIVASGKPCITAVDLSFMPYSLVDSRHVVVVVGWDGDSIFVLDPAESVSVIQIAKDGFIAAWTEMECSYASLTPR